MGVFQWITLVSRLVVGVAFCWSAVPKLVHPDRFFANVLEYAIVGADTSAYVAVVLPWLELLLGLLLLGNALTAGAFMIATALLAGFSGLQAYALASGLDVSCGCFAVAGDAGAVSRWTVARAAVLCLVAGAGLLSAHLARAARRTDVSDNDVSSSPSLANASAPSTPGVTNQLSVNTREISS